MRLFKEEVRAVLTVEQAVKQLEDFQINQSVVLIATENAKRLLDVFDNVMEMQRGAPYEIAQARLTIESALKNLPSEAKLLTESSELTTESVVGILGAIWKTICNGFRKIWDWLSKTFRDALGGESKTSEAAQTITEAKIKKVKSAEEIKVRTVQDDSVLRFFPGVQHVNHEVVVGALAQGMGQLGFLSDYTQILSDQTKALREIIFSANTGDSLSDQTTQRAFFAAATGALNPLINQYAEQASDIMLKAPGVQHYVRDNNLHLVKQECMCLRLPVNNSVAMWLRSTSVENILHPLFLGQFVTENKRGTVTTATFEQLETVSQKSRDLLDRFQDVSRQLYKLETEMIEMQNDILKHVEREYVKQGASKSLITSVQVMLNYITANHMLVSRSLQAIDQAIKAANAYLRLSMD